MEDTIKREKLYEHIKAVCLEGDGGALITSEDFLKMAIKNIPSAENKGEWKFISIDLSECSECGGYGKDTMRFCPACGCRMEGADDDSRRTDKETE